MDLFSSVPVNLKGEQYNSDLHALHENWMVLFRHRTRYSRWIVKSNCLKRVMSSWRVDSGRLLPIWTRRQRSLTNMKGNILTQSNVKLLLDLHLRSFLYHCVCCGITGRVSLQTSVTDTFAFASSCSDVAIASECVCDKALKWRALGYAFKAGDWLI